jgi:protoporphyrin/coproporphyrin ferrochelatase
MGMGMGMGTKNQFLNLFVYSNRVNMKRKKNRGVLLVNLGTPRSYKPIDVFRYLNEFLTDPRVMDLPWLKRQFLVRGVIVPSRYRQSATQYRCLWTEKGSPLLVHGQAMQEKLQLALGSDFKVVLAMRYQSPSIPEGLEKLREASVDEIIILPLFPQYASATTGSVHQQVMRSLQTWEVIPKLIFIDQYFDHPLLIEAFCERAKQYQIASYDQILFSFHGLPERQIRKADAAGRCLSSQCCQEYCLHNRFCYKAQCYATARAIAGRLGLEAQNYTICFQSRLGKDPWIQPYVSDILQSCIDQGQKRLLVLCPSFVSDCLETIYEIIYEYGHKFKQLGGEELQLVEGLNSHPTWIETLRCLVLEQMENA